MKRWDNKKWIELLEKINQSGNFQFIFVGGEKDLKNYERIYSSLSFVVHSLINKIDIPELLVVFKNADYFIGVDSGPSNLAYLAGLKGITIFGAGPHFHINSLGASIDKTNGRGLGQLFFSSQNSFISRITVDEVYRAFQKLRR